ncbi:TPA: ATP-binding cassette domain-containing protein, partial [Enterococcus faecium]
KNIYIFDEITNGLDECVKQNVVDYLFGLKGMKIFITHDKEVISKCEKEYTVKDMKIVRRR